MRKSIMMLGAALMFVAMTSCGGEEVTPTGTDVQVQAGQQYQCPMDCEAGKTYDAEGKCPECKMDLKAVE